MEIRGAECGKECRIYIEIRRASWTKKTRHSGSHCDVGQKFAYNKVGRVHLFVGLTRECEDCQKIIRCHIVRKQAQKPKITNDIKIHLEFRHESQSNKLKVLI
ncbi:conserved hypothetical protein [Trichinella spiralis]|uniref:hypothetical protein n=1 Tax=Trichinella spiralis TaxID=6334 RepID=UPI0001EFD149|nr:conserved hypothetical protein [Trichinella spiralis]